MVYFNSKDVAIIALCAALWGVLNAIFSPIFFQMFGLPFLCDLIGFTALTITVWWTRKLGSATMVGLIATIINFIFNPAAITFLGFTAASIVFDAMSWLIRYKNEFRKATYTFVSMTSISTLSAAVAGFIIGTLFMTGSPVLAKWGGALGWAALHAVGGIIGGIIGSVSIVTLISHGIQIEQLNTIKTNERTENVLK
ncbi:MAG: hypothetical protein QG670_2004 [Thermoproteota archaeon]|nr:hypothetical protein [Thermoproteota archaeon]